jgi:hypothetical protein
MSKYNHDIYRRSFARLLNKAIKRGGNSPQNAMIWLENRYKLFVVLMFTRYRVETTDAYMDVREHLAKRISGQSSEPSNNNEAN